VGDEGLHMAGVVGNQCKSRDGATAAATTYAGSSPTASSTPRTSSASKSGSACWPGSSIVLPSKPRAL
jgi:hypothetical protein